MGEFKWSWVKARYPRTDKFFLYYPNGRSADAQVIDVCGRDGNAHATLIWNVCHSCRHGLIAKISIIPEWQRQGLGRRLLMRALYDGPGYNWATTSQSPEGQPFFPAMARESRAALTNNGQVCDHIDLSNRHFPKPRLEYGI
ncbi:GNAT family N-acetyltransferase [Streptomyces sp. NPDC029004]|uniref:GNAT family N-acetyltransferase n=1 Tax=Streptomyces sp. NPDC029004 TaxID=3154490 RepID=UPI0033C1650A